MASYGAFQFAGPGKYGDWAQYAGFDRTTGDMAAPQAAQPGVPPPQNIQEFAQQAIAPYQQKLDRVTAAAGQLQEGNVMSAYGAYRGAKQPTIAPVTGQPATQTIVSNDYDYTHALK